MNYRKIGLKRLDIYIIKKFLGTFFYSIVLILSIAVVFDVVEKIDDFYDNHVSLHTIIFDYYFGFIPFYANLFFPLFTFLSVIFFTSKMANDTEIVAILSGGVSFNRLLRPYFISAAVIMILSFILGGYIIPSANKKKNDFENQYVRKYKSDDARNVQMAIQKGVILYVDRYEMSSNRGYRFSLDKFEDKTLVSRLTANTAEYDSIGVWHLRDYTLRNFNGLHEVLTYGEKMDTVIDVTPKEFFITSFDAREMDLMPLRNYIKKLESRGFGNTQAFEDEYYRRFSMPIAALIMTLIAVSLSSKKVRGGMGLNLGIGLGLSAFYILFISMSSAFAVGGVTNALVAVWLPNILFLAIGIYLYRIAPK